MVVVVVVVGHGGIDWTTCVSWSAPLIVRYEAPHVVGR